MWQDMRACMVSKEGQTMIGRPPLCTIAFGICPSFFLTKSTSASNPCWCNACSKKCLETMLNQVGPQTTLVKLSSLHLSPSNDFDKDKWFNWWILAPSLTSRLVWFHVHPTLFLVLHALRTMHDSLFTAFRFRQILRAKMLGFVHILERQKKKWD